MTRVFGRRPRMPSLLSGASDQRFEAMSEGANSSRAPTTIGRDGSRWPRTQQIFSIECFSIRSLISLNATCVNLCMYPQTQCRVPTSRVRNPTDTGHPPRSSSDRGPVWRQCNPSRRSCAFAYYPFLPLRVQSLWIEYRISLRTW